ncbi:MAG: SH3 domain-containing protein [Terricaulis sp.]
MLLCTAAGAADAPRIGPDSHEPVPRFVSLRTESANGRHGPGVEHRIDWIYERAGLPMQVTAESGPWRRVRDPDGGEVWMHAQNLDSKRTAYVRGDEDIALRDGPRTGSHVEAYLAPGVVGSLTACEGDWRRISVRGRVGWAPKDALWGVEDCSGL